MDPVIGPETLLLAVFGGIADDVGTRGQPDLLAVEDDFLDVTMDRKGRHAFLAENGQPLLCADINTAGGRLEAVDIVRGKAVFPPVVLPGAVRLPAEDSVAHRGAP